MPAVAGRPRVAAPLEHKLFKGRNYLVVARSGQSRNRPTDTSSVASRNASASACYAADRASARIALALAAASIALPQGSAGGFRPVLCRLSRGFALRPGGEEPDLCVLGSGTREGPVGRVQGQAFSGTGSRCTLA